MILDVWNTLHVVTQPDTYKTERGRHLVESPVKLLAAELNLQCHLIPKDKSAMKEMRFPQPFHRQMHHPSQLLIVSSLGRFIPWKVLKKFHPSRKLNVHPSLIPKYRGAGPIQWAIADGLEETGVSIIEVEKVGMGYDVGDIWAQKTVPIPPGATYPSLMPILADEGSELLVSVLRNMINGTQSDSIEQDPDQATEAPAIDAQIAVIDWWRWNAKKVEQVSRAIMHQKPIYSYVFDHETTLQLFDVSILPKEHHNLRLTSIGMAELNWKSEKLEVQCNSDTQVSIGGVKQKNKKLMPAREWWLGVNEKKKSEGMIQFHMGPWRDETIHPEFKHS
ncbi:Methionyl-tRNA formyltransferase [Serendipita sp. 396]|nr:Methionyl-tRNA formyltransferase [Serendipita sp. 396]